MNSDSPFSQENLNRCISCGFCLPACPTYALTGDESASPRGRINLMRALQAGVLDFDDPSVSEQASLCLGCRACEPVCPAGVEYGQLLEEWRDQTWHGNKRPFLARVLTQIVEQKWLLRLLGFSRRAARSNGVEGPWLMLGCFERALFPSVSKNAKRILPALSVPADQGCCGALHAHNGDTETGRKLALALGERLPGTIVTTAGGCAAHLAHVLGRERVLEFSEAVVADGSGKSPSLSGLKRSQFRIAIQDSCHLRNGLGVISPPRQIIDALGQRVELENASACCGAAGTYSLLRPTESNAILQAKIDEIIAADVDYVVTLNPGCQRQIASGLRKRKTPTISIHLADLMALLSAK
jgi:glycolate oxidase iron-sulfur subunit